MASNSSSIRELTSPFCSMGHDIMQQRNAIYQDSFRSAGVLGAAAQIVGCTSKLWTLVTLNPSTPLEDEGERNWPGLLRNVLLDLHNFTLLALLLLDENNFDGHHSISYHYDRSTEK